MRHNQSENSNDDPQQTTSDSEQAQEHSLSLFMDLMERDLRVLQKDVRGILDKLSEQQTERYKWAKEVEHGYISVNNAMAKIYSQLAEIQRRQAIIEKKADTTHSLDTMLTNLAARLDVAVSVLEDEVDNLRNPVQLQQENGIDDNKQSNDVEMDSDWQFMIVRRDDFDRLRKDVKRLKKRLNKPSA